LASSSVPSENWRMRSSGSRMQLPFWSPTTVIPPGHVAAAFGAERRGSPR
jgi:hypothetical protein